MDATYKHYWEMRGLLICFVQRNPLNSGPDKCKLNEKAFAVISFAFVSFFVTLYLLYWCGSRRRKVAWSPNDQQIDETELVDNEQHPSGCQGRQDSVVVDTPPSYEEVVQMSRPIDLEFWKLNDPPPSYDFACRRLQSVTLPAVSDPLVKFQSCSVSTSTGTSFLLNLNINRNHAPE